MLEEISDISMLAAAPGSTAHIAVSAARARHAQLAVAVLFLVNGAAVGSWVPHIPERAVALHLNAAQLGSTLLAAGIGALCAMPLSGTLLNRAGSRRLCIVTGLLFPALLTIAILMPSLPLLVAVLFVTGLTAAGMDVAMNSHGVLVESLLGRRTVSLFHAIFSVGCFAGAGTHSFLMAEGVRDSRLVPSFGVVLLLLVLGAASFLLPKPVEDAQHAAERQAAPAATGGPKSLRAHLPHPRLLLIGVLCFSTMVSEGAMGDWSALFLRVVYKVADGAAGYGYTCFAALMVLGRFTGDAVVSRIGELRALRLGGLISVAGLLLLLLSHSLPVILVGFALAGAGLANASPVLYRTAGTLPGFAPGEGIATAVGVGYAGLLIGPPLLGFLAHRAGMASIFWVLVALSATLFVAAPLVRSAHGARSRRC
ncbi:MFS transporter [Acidipila sp. EB88]|uniref:MFS transporter n=1 Tax=Acidipila sp. EB88 TaxID=2305226 RepID=UPI000F5E3268|nr:MFS transporter [Acidipila sp. EB88]RRA48966.1 MFS transporter [Acidipila sp. EB88]